MASDEAKKTQYISVPVPEQHVPAVIELLAQLNREHSPDIAEHIEARQITESDEDLVRRMFDESESTHRRLLLTLAEAGENPLYTSEIAERIGVKTGRKGMAGVFGAFGRRAKHRYEGVKPWQSSWDFERGEASYRMSPEVASWILRAAAGEGGGSWS
jgi:hypothetical protein